MLLSSREIFWFALCCFTSLQGWSLSWTLCFLQQTFLWFVGFFRQLYPKVSKVFFAAVFWKREGGHWSSWVDGDTFQTFSAESGYTTGCIWICWHFQLWGCFSWSNWPNAMAACYLLDAHMTTGEAPPNSLYGHDLSKKPEHPTKNPRHIPKVKPHFGGVCNLQCFGSLVYGSSK